MKRNAGLSLGVAGLLGSASIFTTRCSSQNDPGIDGHRRRDRVRRRDRSGRQLRGHRRRRRHRHGRRAAGTGGNGSGGSTDGHRRESDRHRRHAPARCGAGTGGAVLNINDIVPGLRRLLLGGHPERKHRAVGNQLSVRPGRGRLPVGRDLGHDGLHQQQDARLVEGDDRAAIHDQHQRLAASSGTRCYTGGTPASTPGHWPNPSGPNNTWYVGGTQFNDSIWNTLRDSRGLRRCRLTRPTSTSRTRSRTSRTGARRKRGYQFLYNASFPVLGGGNHHLHDSRHELPDARELRSRSRTRRPAIWPLRAPSTCPGCRRRRRTSPSRARFRSAARRTTCSGSGSTSPP